MISTIIFSKNRACQLDLLLRSIEQNFTHISNDIRIIYTHTDSEFEKGYSKLVDKFPNYIWYEQVDFQKDTLFALSQCKKHVCFFVDDDIVYNTPNIYGNQIEHLMTNIEDAGCFSFRLGLNTVIQDPYSKKRIPKLPNFIACGIFLAWDWTQQTYNNFGYPFSVDGHVYNTQLISEVAQDFKFNTPNAFEGCFPAKQIPRGMFCLTQSCVINNPINLVGSSENNAGHWWGHTLKELNDEFLSGKTIDLESLCKNEIVGCHQEMKIKLI